MTDLHIFSKTGELILTEENLPDDPALRERFPVLRDAYHQCKAAESALEEAKDTLANCVTQVANAEQFLKVHFPYRGDAGRIADLKAMIRANRGEV